MRRLFGLLIALTAALAAPASAQLPAAATAPAFTAQVAQGGTVSSFTLAAALAHGPVVLYFFPKSFTSGCTAEAHDFAEHIGAYKALGATVVGVSGDAIATQEKFSTQECRSKFLVASDPGLEDREVLRFGRARALRRPHVVRDRARRQDRLRVHEPRSRQARRQHARRAARAQALAASSGGNARDQVDARGADAFGGGGERRGSP